MLVVTVELWPLGDRSRRHTLGVGVIANDGTGTIEHGGYDAAFGPGKAPSAARCRGGRLKEFPRTGGRMRFWHLVMAALVAAFGEDELSRADSEPKGGDHHGKSAAGEEDEAQLPQAQCGPLLR